MTIKNIIIWALRAVVALILLQTLYFKFTAHPQSVAIFTAIGLEPYSRIGIGILELIASILILWPRTTAYGATLSTGLMAGALFFHLTSLGIEVDGDSVLFYYALTVFLLSIILMLIHKNQLMEFIKNIFKGKLILPIILLTITTYCMMSLN